MSRFTPGPWVIDWNVSRLDIFGSDEVTFISSLRRSTLSPDVDKAAIANARLIAAAPEMYAVLKSVTDMVESFDGTTVENEVAIDTFRALMKRLEG